MRSRWCGWRTITRRRPVVIRPWASQPLSVPAHREERRPDHLGQILARQRKVNLDAAFDAPAGVLREPQERTGDPPFDALGHQLAVLALQFVQAIGNHPRGVDGNGGKPMHAYRSESPAYASAKSGSILSACLKCSIARW
jgi:hypothetical protein